MTRNLNGDIRIYEYLLTRNINGSEHYRINVQVVSRAPRATLIQYKLIGLYRCDRAKLVGCYPLE